MSEILMILGRDVHNKPMYQVYYELIKRKYKIDVYAIYYEDIDLALFKRDNIKIHRFEELKTEQDLEKYMFIYTALPLYRFQLFRLAKKFMFCTPTTYAREVYFCSDFSFMARKMNGSLLENEKWGSDECNLAKMAPCMATGLPTHEGLNFMGTGDSRTILFIDSGHFPFGGKKELSKVILQIAKTFPEYKIRVKPRYIEGDHNVAHRNDELLAQYLDNGDKPNNIEIIRKHTDLRDELKSCYLLISDTITSSYIEAALANRKILLLEGLPNEESKDISLKVVERQEKIAALTKCVVNYKDIMNYLPEGLTCSEDFLKKFVYKREGVTKSVVDAMEYIYDSFISKNKFPKEDFYCSDDYVDTMNADENLSWESIIQRRYRTWLYDISTYDGRIYGDLDFRPIIEAIEETRNIVITEENFGSIHKNICSKLLNLFENNREKLMKTALSQSYFFELLYLEGRISEIDEDEVLCNTYYKYLQAKELSKIGNWEKCIELLNEYFSEVQLNQFDRTLADEPLVKASGHFFRGMSYFSLERLEEAKKDFEICEELWNGKHKRAKEYLEIISHRLV